MLKQSPIRSKKLRESARGQQCMLNGPNCTRDPETTVFCHLNESFAGKGIGIKADDISGFYACCQCHADYDQGRLDDQYFYLLRAVVRTLRQAVNDGVVRL